MTKVKATMIGNRHLGQDVVAAAASKCSEVDETPPASKRGSSAHASERGTLHDHDHEHHTTLDDIINIVRSPTAVYLEWH